MYPGAPPVPPSSELQELVLDRLIATGASDHTWCDYVLAALQGDAELRAALDGLAPGGPQQKAKGADDTAKPVGPPGVFCTTSSVACSASRSWRTSSGGSRSSARRATRSRSRGKRARPPSMRASKPWPRRSVNAPAPYSSCFEPKGKGAGASKTPYLVRSRSPVLADSGAEPPPVLTCLGLRPASSVGTTLCE